jgi:hypothetical protein
MKKIILSTVILLSLVFAFGTSKAQVGISVNIGLQPEWGPVGYNYVDYYFIPQYGLYYYIPERKFIYLNRGKWVFATALPRRFGAVNLFNTYKVVINEPKAYLHYNDHKVKYEKFKGGGEKQEIIRDTRDSKYAEARKNAGHNNVKAVRAHKEAKADAVKSASKTKSEPRKAKVKTAKNPKHAEGGQQPK